MRGVLRITLTRRHSYKYIPLSPYFEEFTMSTHAIKVLLNALSDKDFDIGLFAKLNITCDELPYLLPAVMQELQTLECEEIDELDATDFKDLSMDNDDWEIYKHEHSISGRQMFIATYQSMTHQLTLRKENGTEHNH